MTWDLELVAYLSCDSKGEIYMDWESCLNMSLRYTMKNQKYLLNKMYTEEWNLAYEHEHRTMETRGKELETSPPLPYSCIKRLFHGSKVDRIWELKWNFQEIGSFIMGNSTGCRLICTNIKLGLGFKNQPVQNMASTSHQKSPQHDPSHPRLSLYQRNRRSL